MHGRHAASAALLPTGRLPGGRARRAALRCVVAVPASRPRPAAVAEAGAARAAVALRCHGGSCRSFASGPNFQGFPFGGGGGFPGSPPRGGDSDTFYKLLGCEKGASEAEIKQAYKKQAMEHHPDRGGDENTFKEISRAYEVLSNPEKRQVYDTYGEQGLEGMDQGGGGGPQHGMDPFDLFSQIFGFNAGGGRRQRGRPVTADSTYELQLSLEELYSGTTRNIVFNRDALCGSCKGLGGTNQRQCSRCDGTGVQVTLQQMGMFVQQMQSPCGTCSGKGYIIPPSSTCKACSAKGSKKEKKTFSVDVESGAQDGTEYRFRGQADEAPGHDTGDVVILIRQKGHKTFQRIKDALVMSKKISLSEALCGFQFSTTFLDGEELVIRSTPGQVVRPGDMMVIKGKGMPRPHGQKPGDLHLVLEVEFPESIPVESRDALAGLLGGRPIPEEPPLGAEVSKKLTPREAQELKQRWTQSARQRQQQQAGGNAECVQQ